MDFNKHYECAYIKYIKILKKIDNEMKKSTSKEVKNAREFLFQKFDYKKIKKS